MTPQNDEGWSARKPLMIGGIALLVLVGGFGTWATQASISGAIIASGLIEVDQNRQIVQHPDGGVVEEIIVDEGDFVEAGQTLIRLDPSQLASELAVVESQLFEVMARTARLRAERDDLPEIVFPEALLAEQDNPNVADLIQGQSRLFFARAASKDSETEQLGKRRVQIADQIQGIEAQEAALTTQVALIEEELASQQTLLDRGLAQAARVLSLQRERARLSGTVGELKAQKAQAAGRVTEIDIEIVRIKDTRREEAITQLRDLQVRELELGERRRALLQQLQRLDITAPVSGIVYGLTVFTPRSVIRPADPVLYLVPQDRPLIIAARVEPIHIDKIHLNQDVTLRFSALDQRTTPELIGRVLQISADAFTDEGSRLSYYRAEIALKDGQMARLPEGVTLIPGMPVETFIQTDARTPLAYLIKPLADYFTKAFRES